MRTSTSGDRTVRTIIRIIASGFIISLFSGTDAVSESTLLERQVETHAAAFAIERAPDAIKHNALAERLKEAVSREKLVTMIYKTETSNFEEQNTTANDNSALDKDIIERQIDQRERTGERHEVLEMYRELENLFSLPN